MTCSSCQTVNPSGAKFCMNCGEKLGLTCPACGTELPLGAKFCFNCGYKISVSASLPSPTSSPPATRQTLIPTDLAVKLETARAQKAMVGERRIVTMLFCDVQGSTAAAEQLDPEEWAEIMNGVFEYMIRPIYKYEGTVARLMGDAILAFFGAPVAHEDDPQRAILAGLDIIEGFAPYREQVEKTWEIEINVRVGINTGLVIVGAVGSDLRMEYTALGDEINLAARMEQTAIPGTVQISENTYKWVAPLFEFEALGEIAVKGKAKPIKTFRPLGVKTHPGKLRGIKGLDAPMIGRGKEKADLEQAVSRLEKGIGGMVCVLGEAGLGKSRLLQEFRTHAVRPPIEWRETLSLSYETEQPYGLIRRLIRRTIKATPEDTPEIIRNKIQQAVENVPPEERPQIQRVFESLFGLTSAKGEQPLEGETFKGLLYNLMLVWWRHQMERGPVVLVCDDLHWADPASVALLEHWFTLTEHLPLLLLFAMRLEPDTPGWCAMQVAAKDFPHRYTEIRLQALSADESGELVDSLLRISDLPVDLRKRIMEKSEGNPYFIEEVVRTLIDQGLVIQNENGTHWAATGTGSNFVIPGNLQTLLVARMDRLAAETRRILQVASVIGRSFYYRIVQRLVEAAMQELEQHMVSLQRSQLIQVAARLPELEYMFRHALTQEAAYSTILLKERRTFHRRVGETLENLFPDQLDELAPQLAFHFSQGHQANKALMYSVRAGDQALRLFAISEALANYDQAMQWLDRAEVSNAQLIHLYRRRGRALELLLRHTEALEAYQILERLGETRGDDSLRLAGITAQALEYWFGHSAYEIARQRAEEALSLARQLGDRYMEARSLWILVLSYTWEDALQSLHYGARGLNIVRELVSTQPSPENNELLALLLVDLTLPLAATGQVKMAQDYALEAKQIFEKAGNLPMVSTAGQRLGIAYKVAGQFEQSEKITDQAMAIDQSLGNGGGVVGGALGLLDLYLDTGDFAKFFALSDEIIPLVVREGRLPVAIFELYRVAVYAHLGGFEQTLQMLPLLLQFLDPERGVLSGIFTVYMGYAVNALIRAGHLETAEEMLGKINVGVDVKSYLNPLALQLTQIRTEMALETDQLDEALAIVDAFLNDIRQTEVRRGLPENLLLKARVLRKIDRPEEAYDMLKEAHALATMQNARPCLWQICFHLASLESERGNLNEAQNLKEQARTVIGYIADHAGREDLRNSFLALPEVQNLLSKDRD